MRLLHLIATMLMAGTLTSAPAQIPDSTGQSDMRMSAASRNQVIDQLLAEVNRSYVFPDVAKQIDNTLRSQRQRGAYDKITSAQALSDLLSQQMQDISKDRHLRLTYSEKPIPERKAVVAPSSEEIASHLADMRANNFGVGKVERLPMNIGYLELGGFSPAKDAAQTIAAAMTLVGHTDALIVDLRNNGGGDSRAVQLLASYLLDKPTRLNDFYYRDGNRIEQRWTLPAVPGMHYGATKPVYLLTSTHTFSAAEDFAYAMKNIKRATVVGEVTGGGANPGDDRRLSPNFAVFMPLGRAISPITQANWEGVGVIPDIKSCADGALASAQLAILQTMAQREQEPPRRKDLLARIATISSAPSTAPGCA